MPQRWKRCWRKKATPDGFPDRSFNHPLPRGDARAKAYGREPYAADLPEKLLLAQALRAGLPCGRLLELEEARQIPGIVAILTAKDVPGSNRQGILHKDMPVLVGDRVRYYREARL